MTEVSVLIPTFRRPDSFLRAVRSVFAQRGVASFEIIAVDNSPEGQPWALQNPTRSASVFAGRRPKPGVAEAQRRVEIGEAIWCLARRWEASPISWRLIAVRRETGAQASSALFSPARTSAGNAEFYEPYARAGQQKRSLRARLASATRCSHAPCSTNHSISRADQCGGRRYAVCIVGRGGATFAAKEARVVEHLGAERTHLAHGLKRAFAYGQGPSQLAWAARNIPALARHMCVGAAQAIVYGAASAAIVAGSTPHALSFLDRAARGAGKVFWFCEQRFYGQALVRQPA
jgi:hypothetical protein